MYFFIFRTWAAKTGPSNMYEFSLVFIFAVALIYLLFERSYGARQLGAIVMPIAPPWYLRPRTVEDAQILFRAVSDDVDVSLTNPIRVGVPSNYFFDGIAPTCAAGASGRISWKRRTISAAQAWLPMLSASRNHQCSRSR